MDLETLKNKLLINNVPGRWYSIDNSLKPDACILYKNYSSWEFFYLDEKGERRDYRIFVSADDVYEFLWEKMENHLKVFKISPPNESK